MTSRSLRGALAIASMTLAGCGTAPAAIEQAHHTVKLMASMEEPLAQYRQTWTALEQSRLHTLRMQRRLVAETDVAAERSRLARLAAGDTMTAAMRDKLLANADAMQLAKIKSSEGRESYDERINALLQPLPSTASTVTAAQGAVAKMGTELPKELRAKELLDFAKEVKKGIDASRQAQKDAMVAADATAATLSTPAPSAEP